MQRFRMESALATVDPSLPWEELLQHGRFVRELARSLVRDASRADDVVQETWLAVARRPPGPLRFARAWLREVVTNVVRQERRADARRGQREQVVAADAPDATLPVDVEAAQLEAQRLLLAAVEQLDAKYRSVVMLRFYEGLPPRTIATRLGLPVATVRTQLQRAVEQLRERLDATSPRGREQWLRALAPLLVEAALPTAATLIAAAAVVVLLAGGAWWWNASRPAPPDEGGSLVVASGTAAAATEGETPTPQRTATAATAADAVVSGQVVDLEDRPIAGAVIGRFDSWGASFRSAATLALDRTVTAADGSFAFAAVDAGTWTLVAARTGWTSAEQTIRLLPARRTALGCRFVLSPSRAITGFVHDAAGAPVAGAQLLACDGSRYDAWRWPAAVSDAEGRFTLEPVPESPVWINVVAAGFAKRRIGPIALAAAPLDLELVVQEPATLDWTVLDELGSPAADVGFSFMLEGAPNSSDGSFRLPGLLEHLVPDRDGRLVTASLPVGKYRAALLSATSRFEPGSFEFVLKPGERTVLVHQAAFTIGAVRLQGVLRDGGGLPRSGRVVAAASSAWERPQRAITADDGRFEIDAPVAAGKRFALWLEDADEVLSGEQALLSGVIGATCDPARVLELVAERGATLAGVVVQEDGAPLAGARVEAERQGAMLDDESVRATSGVDGRFALRGLASSARTVRLQVVVGRPESRITVSGDRLLAAGTVIDDLRLVVPALAVVEGRVVDGGGAPVHGALVVCQHPSMAVRTLTAADGSFRLAGISAGERTLRLERRRVDVLSFGPQTELRDEIELTLAPGEVRTGIELVATPEVDARTLHGRIEASAFQAGFEEGELFLDLETSTAHGVHMRVEDGDFCIRGIADPTCRVGVSWRRRELGALASWQVGFAPMREVAPGVTAQVIEFPEPALDSRVVARVVNVGGQPLPEELDLTLALIGSPSDLGPALRFDELDADGRITWAGLRPGRYRVALPHHELAQEFELVASGLLELPDLVLPGVRQVAGVVVDAAGAPFAGARVGVTKTPVALGFMSAPGADPFEADSPSAVSDEDGRFVVARPEDDVLVAWAVGFAPRTVPQTSPDSDEPIVLLPAGDVELTGMPDEIRREAGWRFTIESLESDEARCGYPRRGATRSSSRVDRSYACWQIPVGLYAVSFWKGDPNRVKAAESSPATTIPHEAYRFVVEVKAGQKTTIDLAKEW